MLGRTIEECLDPKLACQLTIFARDVLVPSNGLLLRRRRRLSLTQCTCPLGVQIVMWTPETGPPRIGPAITVDTSRRTLARIRDRTDDFRPGSSIRVGCSWSRPQSDQSKSKDEGSSPVLVRVPI